MGAMAIEDKYPFLSLLYTLICRLNKALDPLSGYFI